MTGYSILTNKFSGGNDSVSYSTQKPRCPFGALVFTFDRPGRGELVLEDMQQAHGRISLWIEANRNAIDVVKPLEDALKDGEDPVPGMVTGGIEKMREAGSALKACPWSGTCECVRTE